jgi:hypothetical protein
MPLDPQAIRFLERRRRLQAVWPWVAALLAVVLAALIAWLLVRHPLLVNPLLVQEALRTSSLEPGTLLLLAGMLPLVVDVCLLIVGVLLVYACAFMFIERRYQRIVDTLLRQHP